MNSIAVQQHLVMCVNTAEMTTEREAWERRSRWLWGTILGCHRQL